MTPRTVKQPCRQGGSRTTSLAWKYIKVCAVTVFAKTWTKGHWPLDGLWRHICWGLMCDSTQGSLCPSPMKIHQSMWIQWPFCKKLEPDGSLTPRWPLTPHLLRSHVWLYPMIIVSKSHENTSKYVDTVTLFAKTWTKGHWPLDEVSADAKRKKSACTIKVVDSLAYAHALCCVPRQALCECYFCIHNHWSHSLGRDKKSGALLPSDSDWIYTVRLKGCAW